MTLRPFRYPGTVRDSDDGVTGRVGSCVRNNRRFSVSILVRRYACTGQSPVVASKQARVDEGASYRSAARRSPEGA